MDYIMMKTPNIFLYCVIYFLIMGIQSPRKCTVAGESSTIACEGSIVFFKCPYKSLVIKIAEAKYGRDLSKRVLCQSNEPEKVIKDCGESNVASRVRGMCDGKTECSFTANNRNLGAFCANVYKYLIVLYNCVPRPTTDKPPKATPTTQSRSTLYVKHPTTKMKTTIGNLQTTANITNENTTLGFTNYTINSTLLNETTLQPDTVPIEVIRQVTPLTREPAVDAYDREIFERNHGISSVCVSGRLVTSLVVVSLLLDVFLLRVT